MPIYEFRCEDCGKVFEALRPVGDRGKGLKCPHCHAGKVQKIFSTFAAGTGGVPSGTSSCGGGGFT